MSMTFIKKKMRAIYPALCAAAHASFFPQRVCHVWKAGIDALEALIRSGISADARWLDYGRLL
ncbi:hypothetical protein D3870_05245 [Noviherbaspirillum cavernae]|uniref:Uncharacterized protein n=1 Tax=Noviherbaspirillum cavernae TaxID=2320862 RepID=A0A418WZJ4_9BURK|nr:hypothetical protein D3870_05245 [Noviherbaspirillum cavernae]